MWRVDLKHNTVLSKMIRRSISFSGSFQYNKTDGNGNSVSDTVLYRETTVQELENLAQSIEEENAESDYQTCLREYNDHPDGKRKPGKHTAKQIRKSCYQSDKVVMYRNETMHQKLKEEYLSQIGQDSEHTEDNYKELEPAFGVIVLRSNKDVDPEQHYCTYKKRWKIETHYQHVRNGADSNDLQMEDYYSMQGISFVFLIEGMIYRRFMNKIKSAPSDDVSHMSLKECIRKLKHAKISLHSDKRWYGTKVTSSTNQLLAEMGVDWAEDLRKLSSYTF